jgi:hypothetical protein
VGFGIVGGAGVYFAWRSAPPTSAECADFHALLQQAYRHRERGRFHRAAELLSRLQTHLIDPELQTKVRQLHREVALAADLSLLSLEELVQLAQFQPDAEEWQVIWRQHHGKAIVLDTLLRHDPQGRPYLAEQRFFLEQVPIHLALEELTLLEQLPRHVTQRVVFGFRLGSIERLADGWRVRPVPDSGVFFTDRPTLEALSPVQWDAELAEVLTRQAQWVAERGP